MARAASLLLAGAMAAGLWSGPAVSCGDKLAAVGGGVRFDRLHQSRHPGTLLLYLKPDSALRSAGRDAALVRVLEAAGHQVVTVTDATELERRQAADSPSLVLVEARELGGATTRISTSSREAAWLALLDGKSQPESLAARDLPRDCLVDAAAFQGRSALRAVERALERRQRGAPFGCNTAGGQRT